MSSHDETPEELMARASEALLDMLHGAQAEALLAELRAYQNGERFLPTKWDKEGNPIKEVMPPPPALFAQINKFLKDNGVDRAVKPGDPLDLLADELPEFDDHPQTGDFH